MNIKDFLLDNYIYILIVIILIIITIIGFLADKKGKNKGSSGEMLPNNNLNNNPNMGNPQQGQPMNYQPIANEPQNQNVNNTLQNNNAPLMNNNGLNAMPNTMINPVVNNGFDNSQINTFQANQSQLNSDNNLNVLPSAMQGMIVNTNTNTSNGMVDSTVSPIVPQSVEQINNIPVEPIYQPLSEQKPVFAPIEPTTNIQNFGQNISNNTVGQIDNSMVPNTLPGGVSQMSTNIPSYNVGGEMNNNMSTTPIPTPVTPAAPVAPIPPVPATPVTPTPVMNPTMPMQQGTVPSPTPNGQVSFVYGNQQPTQNNNNGYMQ